MSETSDIGFSCNCGALTGKVNGTHPADGMRIECYCKDCAGAERHFGKPDPDGVQIYWIAPDRLQIDTGIEHLAAMAVSEKKQLWRWYASCCDTPLWNTQPTRNLFVLGIMTDILADADPLGPPVASAFIPKPKGGTRHEGGGKMVRFVLGFTAKAALGGRIKAHPLFDRDTGKPIRDARVLTQEERTAARL